MVWVVMRLKTNKRCKRIMVAEYLRKALKEPEIAKRVNPGLSGKTFIDNVIGAVEREISNKGRSEELMTLYEGLKTEYPAHFKQPNGFCKEQKTTYKKPDTYKARNGF